MNVSLRFRMCLQQGSLYLVCPWLPEIYQALGSVLHYSRGKITTLSCCLCHIRFLDENSNQSSVSDVYQLKVDSSTNSSPSPQQSESLSPAHTSDFRTDDSQPPTLGQEILEGKCQLTQDKDLGGALLLLLMFLYFRVRG